jgi:aquaporin Z
MGDAVTSSPRLEHLSHHGLQGHPEDAPAPQHRASGWHYVDWACEFAGTAFQLFVGFGVVALLESPHSPASGALPGWARLVLIGLAFGLLAAAVALSPVGRRSGAHLNPAVTLGFFLQGHTPWRDLVGFALGQTAGATLAAAGFVAAWGSWATSVAGARTVPATGLPSWGVVAIEAAITLGLLLTIFLMLSSPQTARWTPAVVTAVLTGLIRAGAPFTGASMNPARTFGPDLVATSFPVFWAYVLGPLAGAALAVVVFRVLARERRTLTAKLFHDERYPSVHATSLPAKPHHQSDQAAGRGAYAQPDLTDTHRAHGHTDVHVVRR